MLQIGKNKHPESRLGRRRFLLSMGWALAGLAFAGMTWMTWRFLGGARARSDPEPANFGPPDAHRIG